MSAMPGAIQRKLVRSASQSRRRIRSEDRLLWLAFLLGLGVAFLTALTTRGTELLSLGLLGPIGAVLAARTASRRPGSPHDTPSLGPYTLERVLGEGGMGTVYRARHQLLPRAVAVKVVRPGPSKVANVQQFEREARLTSMLSHPNIVTLHDYGVTRDRVGYAVMELVDGISLDRWLETRGAMPAHWVHHVLSQVATGLAHVHERGYVHRDIKPSNVMVSVREGRPDVVKILDFGLAAPIRPARRTKPKLVVGTPRFMAPESFSSHEDVGPSADVYAVGALGYALLTGRCLFDDHSDRTIALAHRHEPPLPPSLRTKSPIPLALEDVVLCCLRKSPDQRPLNGTVLLRRLLRAHTPGEHAVAIESLSDGVGATAADSIVGAEEFTTGSFALTKKRHPDHAERPTLP